MGDIAFYMKGRIRQTIEQNVLFVYPNLSDIQSHALVRRRLQEMGCFIAETGMIWHWPEGRIAQQLRQVQGEEHWSDTCGNLILVPHFGNWEVLSYYLPNKVELTALYENRQIAAVDNLVRDARERFGAKLVPTDRGGVRAIIKALRRGESVAVLPDQVPNRSSGGVVVPFFNRPALTQTLVHRLIQATQANVIFVTAQRVETGFKIVTDQVDPLIYSNDQIVSTTAMNRTIESIVTRDPSQYQWEYKRFRRTEFEDPYK